MDQLHLDLPELSPVSVMGSGMSLDLSVNTRFPRGGVARAKPLMQAHRQSRTESASSIRDKVINVARMARKGTICLESALRFHAIPNIDCEDETVRLAIGSKDRAPSLDPSLIKLYRFSETALIEGREIHIVNNHEVFVTSVAKTVADCFKFRSKVGMNVAVHALKSSLACGKAEFDEIMYYAQICRVANVMRPYVEALQ